MFLLNEMSQTMSMNLLLEMVCAAHILTNNMYRFWKFSDVHYNLWVSNKCDPIPTDSSFFDQFQIWMGKNYPSYDGLLDLQGRTEGGLRYQTSNTHPRLVTRNNQSLFSMRKIIQSVNGKPISQT